MSIEIEAKKAEASGVSMSKDKLIVLLRACNRSDFPAARESSKDYALILISHNGTIERPQ